MTEKRSVLFVCTENACRSQMAEALVNHFMGEDWEAYSAGTEPLDRVNPRAIEALKELNIDASHQSPRTLTHYQNRSFDVLVIICPDAEQNFPNWDNVGIKQFIGFEDPSKYEQDTPDPMDGYRRVRDEIRAEVLPFLRSTTSGEPK